MIPILIFALGFILTVVSALVFIYLIYSYYEEAKDFVKTSIVDFCTKNGYEYIGKLGGKVDPIKEVGNLNICFGANDAQHAVKINRDDRQMILYKLLGYGSKGEKLQEYNVLLTRLELAEPALLELRKYLLYEVRPGLVFKKNDLNFESSEFSNTFCVNATPEKFGYSIFTARVCQFFLDHQDLEFYLFSGYLLIAKNVYGKIPTILDQKKAGHAEYIDWLEQGPELLDEIIKKIPKRLVKKELKQYDVFVKKVRGDKITLSLECPKCEHDFQIESRETNITCPNCGAKGGL